MRKKLLALTMIVGMGAGLLGFNANSAQAAAAKKITLNDAKQIALKHAKLTAKQVKFIKAKSDIENGKKVYDIEFYKGNTEYDYEISATTGKILEYDHDVENFKAPIQKTKISLSKAKSIALKHAKLTAKQVKFIKAKSDIENGKKVYDIEFYKGNTEYDYEISATTGKILEYDHDVENFKSPSQKTKISLSKAKSIALKHAKLTAKQVKLTKARTDYDDGVKVYEIEFTHKGMEYEYEISAKTGKILSFEKDRI